MEMILAFAVTLLAIILGFLSTKGLYLVQGFLQLIDRVTSRSKKAVRMDDSRSVEVIYKLNYTQFSIPGV